MKIVIQRVLMANVEIEKNIIAEIKQGLLLFVCFEKGDTVEQINKAVTKIIHLRCFEDENKKMNFNIIQTQGEILSVSQFTLSWVGEGGHRPSFENSLNPNDAKILYSLFNQKLTEHNLIVKTGRFGAEMKVTLINDGPVTFHLTF